MVFDGELRTSCCSAMENELSIDIAFVWRPSGCRRWSTFRSVKKIVCYRVCVAGISWKSCGKLISEIKFDYSLQTSMRIVPVWCRAICFILYSLNMYCSNIVRNSDASACVSCTFEDIILFTWKRRHLRQGAVSELISGSGISYRLSYANAHSDRLWSYSVGDLTHKIKFALHLASTSDLKTYSYDRSQNFAWVWNLLDVFLE